MADHDDLKNPEPHAAPEKTLVDNIIELALSAGGGAVTLLSGLLAAVLILYSGYVLYDTFATERAASSNAWDLLQYKPEILEDNGSALNADALAEINEDYRAWLTVYDTNIDYPVVQGPDDYYYAYHDIYNESSLTGAIYLAAGNSADFSDTYNVIYGHHMDNGAMFGGLDHMTGNETGVVVTRDKIYDVQYFAVITTDAYEHAIYDVGNRKDSVLDFLRSGGEGGVGVGTNVVYFNEEAAEDAVKLVALSTCANVNTNGRLVVIGKMTEHIVMKDVTVQKVWNDRENQDGIRPASLKVKASDGTEAVLTESNGWKAVVSLPKYDNAGEIIYTWTEETVPGYHLTGNVTQGDVTTLTNTHVPATKAVMVRKVWTDDENRDGKRPEELTVTLNNGIAVTLDEENDWKATVAGLYVYENGQPIQYAWTEGEIERYTLTGNETQNDETTLTNTHVPETVSLGVQKIWLDADNQDGIRPEMVTVTLYANDTVAGTVTLSEANEWTDTIDNLYVNENGQPIVYRWEEEKIEGYELTRVTEGAVTTLENTHIPATVDLTVSKVWDDDSNRDGLRPGSLQVTLSNGQSVTLNEDNHWTAGIENLPEFSAGKRMTYTWTEADVPGYTLKSTVTAGHETILTNRHETDKTVATVTKVWDDDGNRDGLRPANLKVTLSNGTEVILNDENLWTATVEGLPVNENGQPITYTWTEEAVTGYTSSEEVAGTTTKITNRHEIAVTDLSVVKEWDDADNQDGIRPSEIHVALTANGTEVGSLTLKAEEDWTGTIRNLPVNDGGEPINYQWTEASIPGYTLKESVLEGTRTTLINHHTPETATLTVRKVWDDNRNQDGIRPSEIRVTLKGNGTEVGSVTLTEAKTWRDSIENLPVYANGQKITYQWTEDSIPGYTLTGTEEKDHVTTLTNRHIPETTTLSVRKVWDDDNDRDRLRPSILAVTLLANGEEAGTVSLNRANDWTASMEDVPVFAAGERIVYTWSEESVEGYTPQAPKTEGTVTTLTNTHVPATVSLTVVKVWEDDGDRDGRRPDTLSVTLIANEHEYRTEELTKSSGWTTTVEVPLNENGRAINYSWKEADVPGYTGKRTVDGHTTTFTNSHTPATTSRTVVKVWNDGDNQDGLRPQTLPVYLMADGQPVQTVTLSEANQWTATADHLHVYEHGVPIVYSWHEDPVTGYDKVKASTNGLTTVLTNTHVPAVQDMTVKKVWNDAENNDGFRPDTLSVKLLADGQPVGTVELKAGNNWQATLPTLPVFAAGKRIAYSWDEGTIEHYTQTGNVTSGEVTVLTNEHENERTVATVIIVWDDDDDRDGVRPDSVEVTLSNGTVVTVRASENWTATVENLPKYWNGEEIQYTWTEAPVSEYEQTGYETEGTVTTITNTHRIARTSVTVVKVWDDDDNRDGIRPEALYATLSTGDTVKLNQANGWKATISDLPVYVNQGHQIIYTWTEKVPKGYKQAYPQTENGVTTLKNTHEPETIDLTVKKVWKDTDDSARPGRLTMTLHGGEEEKTVVLSAGNRWTGTITGLYRYRNGKEIQYTWTEPAVAGYKKTGEKTENGTTIITNTQQETDDQYTLTIHYVYPDGRQAAPDYTADLASGAQYNVASPVIDGYLALTPLVSGTMPAEDVEITVIYIPVMGEIISRDAGAPLGFGRIHIDTGDCLE